MDNNSERAALAHMLETDLETLCAFGPRYTDAQVTRAQHWITTRLMDMGYSPHLQPVLTHDYQTGRPPSVRYNVVVKNLNPERAPRLIVGAHYDTVYGTVGADDNGSGVVGLLYLASQFVSSPVPVGFVFFVNEEPPHFCTDDMGSDVYFKSRAKDLKAGRYCFFVNLDCIGFYEEHGLPSSPGSVPRNALGAIMHQEDFATYGLISEWAQQTQVFPVDGSWIGKLSDLRHVYGSLPAVHFADMALDRNYRMHTPEDTPDTLDFSRMADVMLGVADIIQKRKV